MTTSEQILSLLGANANLKAYFESIRGSIDEKVATAQGEFDDLVLNAFEKLSLGTPVGFNDEGTIFDNTSLFASGTIVKDAAAPDKSEWFSLSGAAGDVIAADRVAVGAFTLMTSIPGGFFETPRYSTLRSRGLMQFVLSHSSATSAQINQSLAASGLEPPTRGVFNSTSARIIIPSVVVDGIGPYSLKLFARFISRGFDSTGYNDALQPQDIDTIGGSTAFTLQHCYYF